MKEKNDSVFNRSADLIRELYKMGYRNQIPLGVAVFFGSDETSEGKVSVQGAVDASIEGRNDALDNPLEKKN